jgi:hypothetical protein
MRAVQLQAMGRDTKPEFGVRVQFHQVSGTNSGLIDVLLTFLMVPADFINRLHWSIHQISPLNRLQTSVFNPCIDVPHVKPRRIAGV